MQFKSYKKGSHTYTRFGKGIEVRDDRPRSLATEFLGDASETYANAFDCSFNDKGFHIIFGRHLPPAPADRLLDPRKLRLSWQTAVRLKQDLESNLRPKESP